MYIGRTASWYCVDEYMAEFQPAKRRRHNIVQVMLGCCGLWTESHRVLTYSREA